MSPETILLAVAAVAFVLYSRLKGQPLTARRLLIVPVVLVAVGASELAHPSSTGVAGSRHGYPLRPRPGSPAAP